MEKKVLMLYGHPEYSSLCCSMAESYADAAEEAGHEVEWLSIFTLDFDITPSLKGKSPTASLENDIQLAQELIARNDHIVLVYPIWWGTMPAKVKGFLDRVLSPGFAFNYLPGGRVEALLKGKTAHVINTCDTPPIAQWFYLKADKLLLKRPILGLCGIQVKAHKRFGSVYSSDDAQRKRWIQKATKLVHRI